MPLATVEKRFEHAAKHWSVNARREQRGRPITPRACLTAGSLPVESAANSRPVAQLSRRPAIPDSPPIRRAAARLALLAVLGLPAVEARAEIYRWTDAAGVPHYTTDREQVPGRYRDSLSVVRSDRNAIPVDILRLPPGATQPFLEQPRERPRPHAAAIEKLEAEIARDRERIKQLISQGRWVGSELATDPDLRELAERLPRLQAELDSLRGGR